MKSLAPLLSGQCKGNQRIGIASGVHVSSYWSAPARVRGRAEFRCSLMLGDGVIDDHVFVTGRIKSRSRRGVAPHR